MSELRREARDVSRGRASHTPFSVLVAVGTVIAVAVAIVVGIVVLVTWLA